jgi:hypothetical protein
MNHPLQMTLAEIARVLEQERIALRGLDVAGIELASRCKLQLEERLRECAAAGSFDNEDRSAVARIRDAALANQLLLVHARACVRGALALATGQPAEPYAQTSRSSPGPLRVNLKG